jgi:hypothetical protein
MPAVPKDLISIPGLAREWNCTRQNAWASLKRWAVKSYGGLVSRAQAESAKARLSDPKQAEKAAKQWKKSGSAPVPAEPPAADGQDQQLTRSEAERQRAWIQIERERISLEKEKKALIPAAEVESEWALTCTMIRDAMLSLPTKLCGRLAAMTDEPEITRYLRTEIRSELVKLSRQLDG